MGKAKDLFEAAFVVASIRDKRSREFKEGVMAAIENQEKLNTLGYRMSRCPYSQGTASFDAWFAGVREGKRLWNVNCSLNRLKNKLARITAASKPH